MIMGSFLILKAKGRYYEGINIKEIEKQNKKIMNEELVKELN